MKEFVYFNGRIMPYEKAKLDLDDLGLLRGYGAFDFLRLIAGRAVLFDFHWQRFERSARELNLKIPLNKIEAKKIIESLAARNGLKEAGARIVLTGGTSSDGITLTDKPTLFILVRELHFPPKISYEKGVKLITEEHQRELFAAKTTDYLTLLKNQQRLKKEKAMEVLYTASGNVLEGATCNFYLFRGDELITAKDNVLAGTRRRAILKIAPAKFKVSVRPVKTPELAKATEAFISSTTRDIVPVVKIDKQVIGNGKVGKNTQYLIEQLQELLRKETNGGKKS